VALSEVEEVAEGEEEGEEDSEEVEEDSEEVEVDEVSEVEVDVEVVLGEKDGNYPKGNQCQALEQPLSQLFF